jgi:hypothetical protein
MGAVRQIPHRGYVGNSDPLGFGRNKPEQVDFMLMESALKGAGADEIFVEQLLHPMGGNPVDGFCGHCEFIWSDGIKFDKPYVISIFRQEIGDGGAKYVDLVTGFVSPDLFYYGFLEDGASPDLRIKGGMIVNAESQNSFLT